MNKRNTPIKQLVDNFAKRRRGTVTKSRKEIQKRFDYLDWEDQYAIIHAFLDASATDRNWIYRKLLDWWDESFATKIQQLWEEYHEERCGWVVIRYLPEDYVYNHMDLFKGELDYYFICKRLAKYPTFNVDRNRFKYSPNDYLYLKTLQGATLPESEAEEILFGMLKDIAYDDDVICEFRDIRKVNIPSSIDCKEIYRAVSDIKKLNCPDTLEKFYEFDSKVARNYDFKVHLACSQVYIPSEETLRLSMKFVFEHAYEDEYVNLKSVMPRYEYYYTPDDNEFETFTDNTKDKYTPQHIDEAIWNELKTKNPALEQLANAFELTLSEQKSNDDSPFVQPNPQKMPF